MNIDLRVFGQARSVKLPHFVVEPLGVTGIEVAVVKPHMGHLLEQSEGQKGRILKEIGPVEADAMLEKIGQAELLPHATGELNDHLIRLQRPLGLMGKIGKKGSEIGPSQL